jgi:hypothetical protein
MVVEAVSRGNKVASARSSPRWCSLRQRRRACTLVDLVGPVAWRGRVSWVWSARRMPRPCHRILSLGLASVMVARAPASAGSPGDMYRSPLSRVVFFEGGDRGLGRWMAGQEQASADGGRRLFSASSTTSMEGTGARHREARGRPPSRRYAPTARSRRRWATFEALKAEVMRWGFSHLGIGKPPLFPSLAALLRRRRSGSAVDGGVHSAPKGCHCNFSFSRVLCAFFFRDTCPSGSFQVVSACVRDVLLYVCLNE